MATRSRQGKAEPIMLMADWDLTSLLPRGIFTREEGSYRATIDLVLASTDLSRRAIRCCIQPVKHGSGHRAIETTFQSEARPTLPQTTSRNCIRDLETEIIDITDRSELDATAGRLTSRISAAIRQLVPFARPSSYGKRWWTPAGFNGTARLIHMGPKSVHTSSAVWIRPYCSRRHSILPTETVPPGNP